MIPRIKEIIKVEPNKIVCLWNTNEIRMIDFTAWVEDALAKPNHVLQKWSNANVFLSVVLDKEQENLVWPNLLNMHNLNGTTELAGLDFSPDILYTMSTPAK